MNIAQAIFLCACLVVGVLLLLAPLPVRSGAARLLVVAVLLIVTGNYAAWRISSMPAPAWVAGSWWPWAFLLVELPCIAYECWTYLIMLRRSDHSREADHYESQLRGRANLPAIDVFIATYNEQPPLLEKTIEAAKALDYPRHRLQIYLGDDGDRPALRRMAHRLGVEYIARPRLPGSESGGPKVGGKGKGGNDRYTFSRSSGEYILLLDADFCVDPNFLYRTLGFLLFRLGVGLVQTPQRFSNPDVIARNLYAADCAPDDQGFFMSRIEPSRDAWGYAFCTGTACLVSRAALSLLDPEFGFPATTISEDFELSFALLGLGFRTVYLNEPLALGLAPETIPDFINQRMRWCAGTVQNLYAPTGPLRGRLGLLARLFYFDGVVYWLSLVFNALLLVAPVLFWFTGLSAVLGSPEAAAAAVLPRLAVREVCVYWLSEAKIAPLIVQVSRTLPAFHVTAAFFNALMRPGSQGFKVTGKVSNAGRIIRWPLMSLFAGISLTVGFGMTAALLGRSEIAASSDLLQLNVAWSLVTILICTLCSLACIEQPNRPIAAEVVATNLLRVARGLVRRALGLNSTRPGR